MGSHLGLMILEVFSSLYDSMIWSSCEREHISSVIRKTNLKGRCKCSFFS